MSYNVHVRLDESLYHNDFQGYVSVIIINILYGRIIIKLNLFRFLFSSFYSSINILCLMIVSGYLYIYICM